MIEAMRCMNEQPTERDQGLYIMYACFVLCDYLAIWCSC